jgi:CHAD domain-containing protein
MARVVEISFDASAAVVCEWMRRVRRAEVGKVGRANEGRQASQGRQARNADRARHDLSAAGIAAAIAEVVEHAVPCVRVVARAPVTIYPLALGRMVRDGWQASVAASVSGWRLDVSRCVPYSPAVTIRDTVCDTQLETEVSVAQQASGLSPKLRQALKAASAAAPSAALHLQRMHWRTTEQNGGTVDIVLTDAFDMPPGTTPRFCELRLASCWEDDAGEAGPHTSSGGGEPGWDERERVIRALFAVAQALLAELPVFPAWASVFAHGQRDPAEVDKPAHARPIDLSGVQTPHAALIAIGANIAQQWFGNEHGLREIAATECVHQMRVAQRRLKTVLNLFPAWVDADWTQRVAPELKWLSEQLGNARDLDVFTDVTLPALAAADIDTRAWQAVLAAADASRLEARERLQAAMRSRRYAQLSLAWLAWLASLPWRRVPQAYADVPLREYVAKRVRKRFKRLMVVAKSSGADVAARHRYRIEAKRLRYTLEFFESIASRRTRRNIAKTLQRIQSALGKGNDAAVGLDYLRRFDIAPYQLGFARGWSEAVNSYAAQEGERLLAALGKPRIERSG